MKIRRLKFVAAIAERESMTRRELSAPDAVGVEHPLRDDEGPGPTDARVQETGGVASRVSFFSREQRQQMTAA